MDGCLGRSRIHAPDWPSFAWGNVLQILRRYAPRSAKLLRRRATIHLTISSRGDLPPSAVAHIVIRAPFNLWIHNALFFTLSTYDDLSHPFFYDESLKMIYRVTGFENKGPALWWKWVGKMNKSECVRSGLGRMNETRWCRNKNKNWLGK